MPLDPIKTTRAISESYRRYLATTFRLRDAHLAAQFESAMAQPDRFVKGPILEATPPFARGCSLDELIEEGVLSRHFRALDQDLLPCDRPLYKHQEQAVRRLVVDGRSIVVATGTGSGKTEAFLIPILNHLMRQSESGSLTPGVRALLLYPMNALANDQLSRLRGLLQRYPAITFGRYTGETRDREGEALETYRRVNRQDPLPNELISRERMRQEPPHILLTNYAMLEYLLLRPHDNPFFDGECAGHWRYLVLDEAHTYGGAKGIEMAMLLRRLKDRVLRPQARLQCIATSATLGRGREDFPEVAKFATRLFGEPVEYCLNDTSWQDVIEAVRMPLAALDHSSWQPDLDFYPRLRDVLAKHRAGEGLLSAVREAARGAGAPHELLALPGSGSSEAGSADVLYSLLASDTNLAHVRRALAERPQSLAELARRVFGECAGAQEALVAMVDLAVQARADKEGAPLLPARYHLFVRAIEGAYLSLHPSRPLYLDREQNVQIDGHDYAVFEIGTCIQCGAAYLVGESQERNGRRCLRQPGRRYAEDPAGLEFYLLTDQSPEGVADNEDEVVAAGSTGKEEAAERYQVCPQCGAIDRSTLIGSLCDCEGQAYVGVLRVPSRQGIARYCPACGSRSSIGLVRRFLTGNDATASVLATALYQQLPPRRHQSEPEPVSAADDGWLALPSPPANATGTAEGRKLLVFSDSRQDAAFFAPYLQRTYQQILRRRLILESLHRNRRQALDNEWTIADLAHALRQPIGDSGLLGSNATRQQAEDEAWRWLLYELVGVDRRNNLEALGLLGFSLIRPRGWQAPPALTDGWGLSEDEVLTLFQVLLHGLRIRGAVLFPDGVSPRDELFQPRNNEFYLRCSAPDAAHRIMAWCPGRHMNSRLDYLVRLTSDGLCHAMSREECLEVLRRIWDNCLAPGNPASPWADCFSAVNLPQVGPAFRLRYDCWKLEPGTIGADVKWYQCDTCRSVTLLNVRDVCPTYRCRGQLEECDPAAAFANNHYRQLYTSLRPIGLRSEEHTAQLTGPRAAELQEQFIRGEVQVISCSTTFELGVDVGELESVLMRNVPPSAANYVQRAGRAGRRTDSAALSLTFAQRQPHDLAHFRDPNRMVSGRIGAPHFDLANEKIARRHVHAMALAAFWREHPSAFSDVGTFFLFQEGESEKALRSYLERRPGALAKALTRVLPADLCDRLDVTNWGWLDGLLGADGVLTLAGKLLREEVRQLEEARTCLIEAGKPSDHILHVINTIRRRNIIGSLSARGVLPKYGFPVDVVELQILHHGDEARGLELDRDLRIALSEYAPSGEVVAGGRLWTSRYLKRMPDRLWPSYNYAVCSNCQRYQRQPAQGSASLDTCIACGAPLDGRHRRAFVVPEFGFIADLEGPRRPGEARPERTYSTRTYYSGEGAMGDPLRTELPGGPLIAQPVQEGLLAAMNHAGRQGFQICQRCGYALLGNERPPNGHLSPWRRECRGRFARFDLGHEYKTDLVLLRFQHTDSRAGFWPSLLYGLLEGAADVLDIDRGDIDGCLYPWGGDPCSQALVLFDNVPGGAGHVQRLADSPERLRDLVDQTWARLAACECGGPKGNASCYGCLRNYRNQFHHDVLERGLAMRFLKNLLEGEEL